MILLREGTSSLEVLLLERSPRSGFIPGAWVFPGGRVDPEDGDARILSRVRGLTPESADGRLGVDGRSPRGLAYWVAGARETFEETGVLLSTDPSSSMEHPGVSVGPDTPGSSELPDPLSGSRNRHAGSWARAQDRLLAGEKTFHQILEDLDLTLDARNLVYYGHWLTPECEPRRYDTRFFMVEVHPDVPVRPHHREMTDYLWITPGEALERNLRGEMPLVLPTLYTLEELDTFGTPGEALAHQAGRPVRRRLPVPERHGEGIRFSFPP